MEFGANIQAKQTQSANQDCKMQVKALEKAFFYLFVFI